MSALTRIGRTELAARIARDIPDGAYVNLGIGVPTLVADHIPAEREVILHTENGLLALGPAAPADLVDPDLINAGKQPVTQRPGAAYFHHADSFAMMRGGHLDLCLLGAYQVSQRGDLANWSTGEADAVPAVGGAMDLASGAKAVHVVTDIVTRDGTPKLVAECSLPLTGLRCVSRVYTDAAIFDVVDGRFVVREPFGANTVGALESLLGLELATRTPRSPRGSRG